MNNCTRIDAETVSFQATRKYHFPDQVVGSIKT